MKSVVALAFGCLITSAMANHAAERTRSDEVTIIQADDPAMAAAIRKAKESLGGFLALADNPPEDTTAFSVKVAVRDKNGVEYFWITPFTRHGSEFEGAINNEPRIVKSVVLKQQLKFNRREIVDWTYIDTARRRTMGAFTMCALLVHESPKDAAEVRERYGLKCDG